MHDIISMCIIVIGNNLALFLSGGAFKLRWNMVVSYKLKTTGVSGAGLEFSRELPLHFKFKHTRSRNDRAMAIVNRWNRLPQWAKTALKFVPVVGSLVAKLWVPLEL